MTNSPKIYIEGTNNFIGYSYAEYVKDQQADKPFIRAVSESETGNEQIVIASTESLEHLTQANIDTIFHAVIDMHDFDEPSVSDNYRHATDKITIDLESSKGYFNNGKPIIGYER